MRVSLWVNTLNKKHIEISNSSDEYLIIADEINYKVENDCDQFDILLWSNSKRKVLANLYKSKDKELSKLLIKIMYEKINQKLELMKQRQIMKKISEKSGISDNILNDIEQRLRNEYFELNLKELV